MAFNLFCITIFGLLWGTLVLAAYKAGMADGKEMAGERAKKDVEVPWHDSEGMEEFQSTKEESQSRLNTILNNIDNYNGTELGQKEV